ncbi:uncharacterized protein [Branchiostoma lanceolatum]|uniref:uncharacterized protein isoform X1 n=1 Tax=Branchiostoma lanceolatum TaxID=7740 RepID=UPI003452BE08
MAGCSSARCSSERRSLRRELDHWRKDLITCVGLESFAEFLMGPERFKEVMPFNGFEAVDCPDWEVSSECRLCHARREVVTESLEHHKELIERQRTQEETSTQDFPGSYVPFKFSSAQEAIRHLASHHASKQQQSSQSALQEDSDNLDSEEDNVPPSPQHNSCNGSSAKRLRNSPYFLKIPRVPFGHEAKEKVSHGHINDGNEEVHPTAQHCSIPATTMKTTSTSSAQHCNGTDPQPKQQKSHSVSHSYQHQAVGKCWSSDKNVSLDGHVLHQSPMRPNDPSPVPIDVQNVNSNTYTDTRCLDEDFLLWVIYSMGRKGRHSFSFEDLEMTCSDKVAGSVTDVVSQAKAAVPLTTTAYNPPTSADDKVQEETPQEHTSTVCQLTSNHKRCHSSLQDMTLDGLRNECNIEAGQLGAKNDPIVDVGKTINDTDMNFDEDKHFVDLHPLYLFKPISLSSDAVSCPLPSDKTGKVQDTDSDTSSCCSISPPSLSPVTGYDTCSERDQSQSSVYSLEENEDNNAGDDPPPPILSPMPTMPWSTTFCPALRKEPQSSLSREKDVCKALCPTDPENCSMGRDSGVNSCSSSKSTEASVCSNQNSTDFCCPPDDSCSGVGVVDNVQSDDTSSPSKIFSNRLYETKGPSTNNLEDLSCIDTDVKVDTSENARKQSSPGKGLATGHGPQHALKGRYLHCLPHRPLSGFAMFEKRKGKDDENKHVGMGHYLLNRTSTRKASLSDLQLQKARILPCHVRLRKLSSRQIPHHGAQPQRTAHVLQGRRIGRPRKWMWVKGRSGKLVRIPIPKKESGPSGVGDIEVLRKLRPSAQRVVRQAQLKTDQVFPSKKIVNSATGTALRPLPVRLAKINDKKFQNTPRRQYNHKGSHQSMQTKRDKAKPVTDVSYTFPHAKQSQTSGDGNEDQFDVKWAVATVCRCKKVQSADLPCTCTFVTSSDRTCKVRNNVPSKKEIVGLASMSAEPSVMRKQKRGNSQTRQKEVKPKTEMKLGIRTLPHRRARTKVLKAFHAIVLKKYQKPESFTPAAIRKLRQLPSRNKRLRESTKSMPSLSKTRRMHLLKTSQKTADCEISQRYCPTRELGIVPNGSSDSEKYKTVNDGDKDALINHTSEPVLEGGADGQYDCKGAEEQMQVEQFSVVLHPMSPSTVKPIIADASGIQSHLHDVSSSKSEESMEIMDMPAVKQEQQHPLDEPGIKSVVKVYEKRQLRVLPERVARLREEERKQQAKNTVTATMASPSLEKLMEFQNNSPFDKDASAEDLENPSLSVKTAEKPVVLNGKIDSKSNYKHNKHITMVHNNVHERTRIPDITCKSEVEDIDDERKLRSLPCRMVAQAHDAWKIKKVRGRPRKHSQLPSDAKSMAKIHRGRPRKNVRPESLNNTIHTKKHVVETMSAEMKSGSICVDQATVQSDDGSSERENCNPPHLVKGSLPDEVTFDGEFDTANIGSSSKQEEDSTTEINTTRQAAASTSGFLVKRKVTHCPKTDLRCECMSLNTSLTLQYQDAIISKGWVKTSEKPGRRDASIIQSLFTQPVTYNTIMRLVAVGSSKTGIFQSQEHMAFTQVAPAPQGKKGTHTQCNSSKGFKKKKKRFEDVSVTSKDLTEDVPISPSKPITTPIFSLRGTKQEKTPRTKINRQADRLRKTLRKFATKTPAKNRIIPYEDVGRRKCKAAKKLFIVPSNPSILWCNHPSSDSKTKGPKANISPNTGSLSGEKDSSKPPSTNTTLNVQPPTKGRIETISNTSSTTLSASSSDSVCRERDSLPGSPENVKKSQGKKSSKKYSNSPSSTSKGSILSKVKPKKASNKKHKVDPVTAIDKSDHRAESPSHTAQASRSSARIQKKQLLGFSICPCCALVEAEHFERFKKRVRVTKEKHQTEKVDLPAKHSKQLQTNEAKYTKKATGSASQLDKPVNLVSTKEMVQKSKDDRSPQNLASPGSYVNSSSDLPPVPCTSSEAVTEDILDDVTDHVPQLGGSSSSPPISSTEQTSLSQWGNLTHGDQTLKEDLGAKNQVASPEVNAVVQIGKVVPECEDVVSSPCEENEWLDEEGFAGPLDLRVSWKKSETL